MDFVTVSPGPYSRIGIGRFLDVPSCVGWEVVGSKAVMVNIPALNQVGVDAIVEGVVDD